MIRVLLGSMLLVASSVSADNWRYTLSFDSHNEWLWMRVCPPQLDKRVRLRAQSESAADYLIGLDEEIWSTEGGELVAAKAGCASYASDLGRLVDQRKMQRGYRVGKDLLSWPDNWLWWPRDVTAQIELRAELPHGWQLSAPWPQPDPATPTYRLDGWPRAWPALVSIGTFSVQRLQHGDGRIDLAVLGELDENKRDKLTRWVDYTTGLLDQSGGFPLPQAQILVVPISSGGGPVPWGQVLRAGYGGVHFFVDADAPYQEFVDDWTGAHELSHLLHPYLGNAGRWMGEGLATYYQNLLRIRSGDLSSRQGWNKLVQGFERGRKDLAQNQRLVDVSRRMGTNRAYMRVYWSGAAYWLKTDVELRRRSGGKQSLDQVLEAFADCCLPAQRRWRSIEFARELDRLAQVELFAPALLEAEQALDFPDLRELWRDLGLRVDRQGQLRGFNDEAPLAPIRLQISRQP